MRLCLCSSVSNDMPYLPSKIFCLRIFPFFHRYRLEKKMLLYMSVIPLPQVHNFLVLRAIFPCTAKIARIGYCSALRFLQRSGYTGSTGICGEVNQFLSLFRKYVGMSLLCQSPLGNATWGECVASPLLLLCL